MSKWSRRPTISVLGSSELQSAYPILESQRKDDEDETVLPPPCRAFSAMIDASGIPSEDANHSEGPDMSSPATQAYAKRQLMPPHPSQAGVH